MKLILALLILLLLGCSAGEQAIPEFDGDLTMTYLVQQTSFGSRVPGSVAWQRCQNYIIENFERFGLEVDSQSFPFNDPYSEAQFPMLNIIGKYRGSDADDTPILLLAHYDSRPRTDYHSDSSRIEEPLMGANDGASGVAVLLSLARMVTANRPELNIDFLMVDGEDWGRPGDSDYYLLGSRYFATHKGNIRGEYRFAIVLDMVGSIDQKFYREGYSEQFNKELNDMVWSVAAKLGVDTFVDSTKHAILDDHMSINVGGVPAIDIIDFDYKFWHTEHDTPDKCSPEALKKIGSVITHILFNRSVWPD